MMEDKIKELIAQHKLAKQECWEELNSKTPMSSIKERALHSEYYMRNVFISELEDIIDTSVYKCPFSEEWSKEDDSLWDNYG